MEKLISDITYIFSTIPEIVTKLPITLFIAFSATIIGFLLGILIALIRFFHIRILSQIATVFISFIRGTPMVIQLYLAYYGIPLLISRIVEASGNEFDINALPSTLFAIIAFALNTGAYMKRLYFKYGVMGSSKSAQALMTAFNYSQKGYKVLLIKPSVDTREKSSVISSRIGLTAPCFTFDKSTNLIDFVLKTDPHTQVLIVDEAQFCTKEQIDELKELTAKDMVVLCYGLKTNFKSELFEGSKRLLEIAESIQEIKAVCRCGSKATINARVVNGLVVTEGKEIQIGGDEKYEAMCYACWKKYQHEKLSK